MNEGKYDESYIKYGFTTIHFNEEVKSYYVICSKVLLEDSIKFNYNNIWKTFIFYIITKINVFLTKFEYAKKILGATGTFYQTNY